MLAKINDNYVTDESQRAVLGQRRREELETDTTQKSKGNMVNQCYFMYIFW